MGRFSPTVRPSGQSPFAAALRGAERGFVEERDYRQRRRLLQERERRAEAAEKRATRQHEVGMARQGYRPEGTEFEVEAADVRGGPATRAETPSMADQIPEDNEFARALAEGRGQVDRGGFVPGDVREGVVPRVPSTFEVGADQAPGRVPLPSGGSISETPPEVARREEERSALASALVEGGMSRPRAEVIAQSGSDYLAPEPELEAGEGAALVTDAQLKLLGATPEEIEATRGNQKARQSLVNDLAGDRSRGGSGVEDTERFSAAVEMAMNGASFDEIEQETGLNRTQAIRAMRTARQGEEASLSQFQQAANDRFSDPANEVERVARDMFVQTGSRDAVMARFDGMLSQTQDMVGQDVDLTAVDVPEGSVDRFVETGSLESVAQDHPELTQAQLAAIRYQGLQQFRSIADEYLGKNEQVMNDLAQQYAPLLMMSGGGR